ncbi:MAG TPA: hypothetical protein VFR02_04580 [bacterium]|nr:hypothetical protein [bacterium]
MDVVQVDLRSGATRLTCWVEPRVRPGDRITLKNAGEPERLWDVLRVGERRPAGSINRGWNNNI